MIIYMADKMKDTEDLKLEALFRFEAVQDDGFSVKIMSRVRRRIWVSRLALPTAIVIGASIAAKPIMELIRVLPKIVGIVPQGLLNSVELPIASIFQGPTIVFGIAALGATLLIGRMLED